MTTTWCQDPTTTTHHHHLPPMSATAHHYRRNGHVPPPPTDGAERQHRLLAAPCPPNTRAYSMSDAREVGNARYRYHHRGPRAPVTSLKNAGELSYPLPPIPVIAHNPGATSPITTWQPNDEQQPIGCSSSSEWHNTRTGRRRHGTTSPDNDDAKETEQRRRRFTLAGSDSSASKTRWKRTAAAGVVDRRDGLFRVAEAEPGVCRSPLLPTPYSDNTDVVVLHWRQQTTTTRDEHEAKTTTTCHHGHDHGQRRTTTMRGPLPRTKRTTHRDQDAQRRQWTTITHSGHWWPRPDATNIYISS